MSRIGKVGQDFSPPAHTDRPVEVPKLIARKVAQKIDAMPLRDHAALGPITLASLSQIDIPHGLGRPAKGFFPFLANGDGGQVGYLYNFTTQLDARLQQTHIRIYNNAAAGATFHLLVF